MDVSVIIVNYNTIELTKACIDSVFAKTEGLSFEVILVDNDSSDGSVECFRQDKRIRFVEAGANLGFGKANNLGLQKAKGKYAFFLNSDTVLKNNAIKAFYDFSESHQSEKIGGVGCLLEGLDGNVIHSYSRFPGLAWVWKLVVMSHVYQYLLRKKYRLYDTTDADNSQPEFPVDYVTGADLFVKRSVIDECGAFDPDFFMYFEETEMQHRWTRQGYLSYIIKTPQIIHLEGGSQTKAKKFSVTKFLRNFESERLYFSKTQRRFGYVLYRCSAFLHLLTLAKQKATLSDWRKTIMTLTH